jgi:pimeloyl-ACP methyl ester carboxylesterase
MPTTVQTPTAQLWADQRGCGDDVVLLAGLCDDSRSWGAFGDQLAERFRVTTIDHRGSGRSSAPPRPWRVHHFVDDVLAVLDHLGIASAHLIGSCLGAVVAQELAATNGQRVRSLVLNGTWRGSDPHFQALLSSWIWTAQHAQTLRELLQVVSLCSRTPAQWERGDVAADLDGSVRIHGLDYFAFRRGFTTAARTLRAYDAGDRMRSITAPALLTVGSHDGVRPPIHTYEVAAEIPDSRVEVIRGAGRRTFADEPAVYTALVARFLGAGAGSVNLRVAA